MRELVMLFMGMVVLKQVGSTHSQPRTAGNPADYSFVSALNSVAPLPQPSVEMGTSRMAQLAQELQQKQQVCSMHVPVHLPVWTQISQVKGCCPLLAQPPRMRMPCCGHKHCMTLRNSPQTHYVMAAVLPQQLHVASLVVITMQQEALYSMASQLSAANQLRSAQAMQFGGLPLYQGANIAMMSPFPGAMSALQQVRHCIPVTASIVRTFAFPYRPPGVGFCMSHQLFTTFSTELSAALRISATHQ